MYAYGKVSKERIETCHWVLQMVVAIVMAKQERDRACACGHRGEQKQNEAYESGNSNVQWPNGKHNLIPSLAIDMIPFPEKWNSDEAFDILEADMWEAWHSLPTWIQAKYTLRSGHDWDMDGIMNEDEANGHLLLNDRPHWELIVK